MSIEADPARSGAGSERPVTATGSSGANTPGGAAPTATSAVDLRTVDLTLSFGSRAVLSDISTDIEKGKITALIGPTGSGKTTLLRTFNRMNDKVTGYHHAGDVLLDGRSIWGPGVELMSLRRRVGMLFQRPNPFPMSILDNVVAGVRAHKMASRGGMRAIAEKRLNEVGLWDAVSGRLKDSPFRLSGGQQQLLCLARALAISPDVLLLDEPTSSLDPLATESIEALIKTLVPDITVIIVTHNLAQARRVADRTIFLYQGHLVEHGDTEQVFEHPAREETAHYVGGRFG
ncbi:MAG TPA: phosphate ABC transporter ATP-binding protein [Streptosporangiaceae bacterium]|jgi:phosphate transport system ATP-binding protein|nr:phosphate ABC transporter ATP-binding protein [Streptosporangiaceae bacterium]